MKVDLDKRPPHLEEANSPISSDGPRSAAQARHWRRAWAQRLVVLMLVFSDLALALLIWEGVSLPQAIWGQGRLSVIGGAVIVPTVAAWLGLRALFGLYPGYGLDTVEELRRHTYAVFTTIAVLGVLAAGFQVGYSLSRLLLALFFLGLLVLAPLTRNFGKWGLKETGLWGRPAVILGFGQNEDRFRGELAKLLQKKWELGYKPIAVFDCPLDALTTHRPTPMKLLHEPYSYKETLATAADLAHRQGVNTAVFAMPHTRREQVAEIVNLANLTFRHVVVIATLRGATQSPVVPRNLDGTFTVEAKYNLLSAWALRAKRLIDLSATLAGGILILPLLIMPIGLLLYLESGRPILYRAQRLGRDGRLFWCLKFRTMVPNAEILLQRMLQEDVGLRDEYVKYHKLRDDPRVTRTGRFLRRTGLDELPQLWNVLRGEMSLVGPRPYLPRESDEIGATQGEILRVPPGITGLWQVSGRNQAHFAERIQMDAYYVRYWSIWMDMVLLARTAKCLLSNRGV